MWIYVHTYYNMLKYTTERGGCMRYLVLEDILSQDERQIVKSEAGVDSFSIDLKDGTAGFQYMINDLSDNTYVGVKFEDDGDKSVIYYAINSELVGTVSISKDQLGRSIEIDMFDDENMVTRGTLPDHNLTILQGNDILTRIDKMMYCPAPTYLINIEENHEYKAFVLAICISLDKFLQVHKGDDAHRRRLFGTRFKE